LHETSPAGWRFGRAYGAINFCAWSDPATLGQRIGAEQDSCSEEVRSGLKDRFTFGRDFNCNPGECGDGTPAPLATDCTFYLNYFHGVNLSPGFADPGGTLQAGDTVRYRYTSHDGGAALVRTACLGWGIIPRSCVAWPPPSGYEGVLTCPYTPDRCGGKCCPTTQPDTFSTSCNDVTFCSDGNPCTADHCNDLGQCTYSPSNCDDGDSCTVDLCGVSGCIHTPIDCDDGNGCTNDACSAGQCAHVFAAKCIAPIVSLMLERECGDGSVDSDDQCDDGNQSAGDCCSPTCSFEPVGSSCADGNTCTTSDVCDGTGACTSGFCDIGKSCGVICGGTLTCQEATPGACACAP
jgi:cysteine-rich repeat protein